ncbi:MAG: hypothetical protein LBH18_03405 [Spirochaetaceae bacterium]|jgi:hypothetical protein|nr:hypothetical protein [Spirochaetaceae bacterium]
MELEELAYNLKWFFSGLLDKPLAALKKLWRKKITRLALFGVVVLLIAVPVVIAITAKSILSPRDNKTQTADAVFKPSPIAPEDLFIPDKPDFLPPVMLERERKKVWTSEDALEFWTPASEFPDDFWQNKISESIDRILEPLP